MGSRYVAFISYSRKDKMVADWIHSKLERFVLPDKEKAKSIFPFTGRYFRPVFLDTQDLHVEERPFTERLKIAIENSSFLIVICSKNSAISTFVDLEIKYFLQTHDNNYSRIVPLFLDEIDDSIPPAFDGTSIMQRHFPIYNTRLSENSEANNYCFYQIISYILGIDFSEVYNRYEVSAEKAIKRRKRAYLAVISLLLLFISVLSVSFYKYKAASNELLAQKQLLIDFEKKVFPAAVVHGYERNFLTPVINYLKTQSDFFRVYILMPKDERELMHQDRVGDFAYNARLALGIDSIPFENLPTGVRRGNRIMRVVKDGRYIDGVYIDFATTTTSFLNIANYKKKHKEYDSTPIDSIIAEYSYDFVEQTKNSLKSDSVYVKFVFDNNELIEELRKNHLK